MKNYSQRSSDSRSRKNAIVILSKAQIYQVASDYLKGIGKKPSIDALDIIFYHLTISKAEPTRKTLIMFANDYFVGRLSIPKDDEIAKLLRPNSSGF